MRARKKPVVIECHPADESLYKLKPKEIPGWLMEAFKKDPGEVGVVWINDNRVFVRSKEGLVHDAIGNCIIMRGVQGELYLCDKQIFDQTYEVLDEQPVQKS